MTNPNGANQYTSDPREQVCWDNYVKSVLNGTENAYQSAIDAGYEESSAKNITLTGWFRERKDKLRRKDMLSKAERNLDKTLDLVCVNEEGKIVPELLKIQVDVSKTIVQTLGKHEGYSTKTETDITTGGEKLNTLTEEQRTKLNELLK